MKLAQVFSLAAMALISTGCFLDQHGHSISVNSSGGSGIKGSGKMKTVDLKVSDFTKISLQIPAKVTLEEGSPSVTFTCDDNLISLFKAETKDGEFTLTTDSSINMSEMPKLVIKARNITRFEAGGASTVDLISGLAKNLEVQFHGATSGKMKGTFTEVKSEASGASKIAMTGSCDKIEVEASGASTVDAKNFPVREATVNASGASNVSIDAKDKLDATASGASSVWYLKEPGKLTRNESGASTIGTK